MSSTRVRRLTKILNFTSTWAGDVLTVTTDVPHNLLTGDAVDFQFTVVPQELNSQTISVTGASSFTISTTNPDIKTGKISVSFFRLGDVGNNKLSAPRSTGTNPLVQSFVTGTGTAVYDLLGSLDGVHWVVIAAALTHTTVSGSSIATEITLNYSHIAIDITSIGAATKLEVLYAS